MEKWCIIPQEWLGKMILMKKLEVWNWRYFKIYLPNPDSWRFLSFNLFSQLHKWWKTAKIDCLHDWQWNNGNHNHFTNQKSDLLLKNNHFETWLWFDWENEIGSPTLGFAYRVVAAAVTDQDDRAQDSVDDDEHDEHPDLESIATDRWQNCDRI